MTAPTGRASPERRKTRSSTLRQTASAVFAVTAIVPLLIFVWTLHRLDALFHPQAQIGIGLALGISLLGFHIFRRLMGQMSDLIAALGNVVARGARPIADARAEAGAPAATVQPGAGAWARAAAAAPATSTTSAPPTVSPPAPAPALAPAPAPAVEPPRQPEVQAPAVPGLGAIQEVHDLNRAMAVLWQGEASAHMGRRVVVSVLNSPRPITGTLVELTDGGLLVETDGTERVTVNYQHISAIDMEKS